MSLRLLCCQLTVILIGTYERALKDQKSVDVAYARLMLLGSAGTGKTCLKHSLMEHPFDPHTTSTIVSDVSTVRPFGHEWQTMSGKTWKEATPEDEIKELAYFFKSSHVHHPSSNLYGAKSFIDEPITTSARQSKVKDSIELILSKVSFSIQTAELAQVRYYFYQNIYKLYLYSHSSTYGIVVVSQFSLRFSQPSSLLAQCSYSCLMLQKILEKNGSHNKMLLMVKCCLVR